MALLLNEIEWGESLLPAVSDPAWEAEIKRRGSHVFEADRRIAPNPWVREACLALVPYRVSEMPEHLFNMGAMITAQENSCRYCYGANRAVLKIQGYSETFIGNVERDLRIADLDDKEHAFIAFCRNLARSRPRPSRAEREALIRLGYSSPAVSEIAFLIAMGCFQNRITTLIACPPEHGFERMANGPLGRLIGLAAPVARMLARRRRQQAGLVFLPDAAALSAGAFGPIVATLAGLPGAAIIRTALDGAFSSAVLSRPVKALMFAIIARTLGCRRTEAEARKLLATDGMDDADIDKALTTLQSAGLAPRESALLSWARETVNYQTPVIQKQTRALSAEIGDDAAVLEAIGVAGLANCTVRLAMLLE